MNRRTFLILGMAFIMLFSFGMTALAAPSPTVPDLNDVDDEYEFENPDVPHGNYILDMISDASQSDDPRVQKVFEKIEKFLEKALEKKGNASQVFAKKVLDLIAELLPDGYSMDDLVIDEVVALLSLNYKKEFGDVKAVFEFATEYEIGEEIVAIVGVFDDEALEADNDDDAEPEWHPMAAEVIRDKDGKKKVKITFTEDLLEAAGNNPVALGILSGKKNR